MSANHESNNNEVQTLRALGNDNDDYKMPPYQLSDLTKQAIETIKAQHSAVESLVTLAEQITRTEQELKQLRSTLSESIRLANAMGSSISEIARRMGVSRQRVYQLMNR